MWYKNLSEFKEENGYDVDGVWYPRVTRILSVKAKPALENFFREMENYSSAEDVKNKSAAEGSLVHDAIQKLAVGEVVAVAPEIIPAVRAFQEFNETRGIAFHPEFIEKRIWSARNRYAGTIDALASVDGKFGVLDIKTSTGFYSDYNLQTAAYVYALQEPEIARALSLPNAIQTRWILRIDQNRPCAKCSSTLREKGGRAKVRNGKANGTPFCAEDAHEWGELRGIAELREFPYFYKDIKAFLAAKTLWEWENDYWLRQVGYSW